MCININKFRKYIFLGFEENPLFPHREFMFNCDQKCFRETVRLDELVEEALLPDTNDIICTNMTDDCERDYINILMNTDREKGLDKDKLTLILITSGITAAAIMSICGFVFSIKRFVDIVFKNISN